MPVKIRLYNDKLDTVYTVAEMNKYLQQEYVGSHHLTVEGNDYQLGHVRVSSNTDPSDLGPVPSPGWRPLVARIDHVHRLPTAEQIHAAPDTHLGIEGEATTERKGHVQLAKNIATGGNQTVPTTEQVRSYIDGTVQHLNEEMEAIKSGVIFSGVYDFAITDTEIGLTIATPQKLAKIFGIENDQIITIFDFTSSHSKYGCYFVARANDTNWDTNKPHFIDSYVDPEGSIHTYLPPNGSHVNISRSFLSGHVKEHILDPEGGLYDQVLDPYHSLPGHAVFQHFVDGVQDGTNPEGEWKYFPDRSLTPDNDSITLTNDEHLQVNPYTVGKSDGTSPDPDESDFDNDIYGSALGVRSYHEWVDIFYSKIRGLHQYNRTRADELDKYKEGVAEHFEAVEKQHKDDNDARIEAESKLRTDLEAEVDRAKTTEGDLTQFEARASELHNTTDLVEAIISEYERAQEIEGDVAHLHDDIRQTNIVESLNAEYDRAVKRETELDQKIDTEISDRQQAIANEQRARETADNALGARIDQEITGRTQDVDNEEARATAEEGRIEQESKTRDGDLPNLETTDKTDLVSAINSEHQERTEAVQNLDDKKVNRAGDTITGSLVVDKDVTVKGNLLVRGNTVSVDVTTLNVDDNFISVNGNDAAFAGLVIRLDQTKAYGIYHDTVTDTVRLCEGTVTVTDTDHIEFTPTKAEDCAILVRTDAEKWSEGDLGVFTKDGNKFVSANISVTDQILALKGIRALEETFNFTANRVHFVGTDVTIDKSITANNGVFNETVEAKVSVDTPTVNADNVTATDSVTSPQVVVNELVHGETTILVPEKDAVETMALLSDIEGSESTLREEMKAGDEAQQAYTDTTAAAIRQDIQDTVTAIAFEIPVI